MVVENQVVDKDISTAERPRPGDPSPSLVHRYQGLGLHDFQLAALSTGVLEWGFDEEQALATGYRSTRFS